MSYNLFLDDIRDIEVIYPNHTTEFVIVRSYDEFVKYISENGLGSFFSFDHDLGKQTERDLLKKGFSKQEARKRKGEEKSGMDCAKWLVNYCMDNSLELPKWRVHSQNPVGAENINAILNNYLRFSKIKTK